MLRAQTILALDLFQTTSKTEFWQILAGTSATTYVLATLGLLAIYRKDAIDLSHLAAKALLPQTARNLMRFFKIKLYRMARILKSLVDVSTFLLKWLGRHLLTWFSRPSNPFRREVGHTAEPSPSADRYSSSFSSQDLEQGSQSQSQSQSRSRSLSNIETQFAHIGGFQPRGWQFALASEGETPFITQPDISAFEGDSHAYTQDSHAPEQTIAWSRFSEVLENLQTSAPSEPGSPTPATRPSSAASRHSTAALPDGANVSSDRSQNPNTADDDEVDEAGEVQHDQHPWGIVPQHDRKNKPCLNV